MGRPDDELMLIALASNELEAQIWRDALAQEGIVPLIRSQNPLTTLGGGALFETFEVLVLGRDEKRARWIIGESAGPLEEEPVREEAQEHAAAD
ncbi:MAG: DUF2007 domain-containing protein [Chloroflexota bacterium]